MTQVIRGARKTAHQKRAFIEALRKSLGIVKAASDMTGVGRRTYYDWLRNDPEFNEDVNTIAEESLDFAETKLFELIQGVRVTANVPDENNEGKTTKKIYYKKPPDVAAVIFYLKTKGKHRGYIEKVEVDNTHREIFITEERTYLQE